MMATIFAEGLMMSFGSRRNWEDWKDATEYLTNEVRLRSLMNKVLGSC